MSDHDTLLASTRMPILLTESDVRAVLSMPDLIAAMDGALTGVFRW
jgi:hypothetical protein